MTDRDDLPTVARMTLMCGLRACYTFGWLVIAYSILVLVF